MKTEQIINHIAYAMNDFGVPTSEVRRLVKNIEDNAIKRYKRNINKILK